MVVTYQTRNKINNNIMDKTDFKNQEEWIWILDFLPYGHDHTNEKKYPHLKKPVVQAIGENYFTLLEIEPYENKIPQLTSRINLKNEDFINRIKCKIYYDSLSRGAKIELPIILEKIVKNQEHKYIDFFNKAYPLSVKMNSLELIPGIGKKLMWDIIEASKKNPFISFEDLKKRVPSYRDPEKTIVKRIILELEGNQKYNIFSKK